MEENIGRVKKKCNMPCAPGKVGLQHFFMLVLKSQLVHQFCWTEKGVYCLCDKATPGITAKKQPFVLRFSSIFVVY